MSFKNFIMITTFFFFSIINTFCCEPSVASHNEEARIVAKEVFNLGGNSVDAFIAAVLAEYVVAPGVTSLAGSLSVLTGTNKGKSEHLDAEFNDPIDPNGQWTEGEKIGKMIFAPAAPKGLYELWKKHGHLKWEKIINPAIHLAENGFIINELYASLLKLHEKKLRNSSHAFKTFFKDGKLKSAGEKLRLPLVSKTLQAFRNQGADYFYTGDWSRKFLERVRSLGGKLSQNDLLSYQAKFSEPLRMTLFNHDVLLPSYRNHSAAWIAAALKLSAKLKLNPNTHYTESVPELTKLLSIQRVLNSESWLTQTSILDSKSKILKQLKGNQLERMWLLTQLEGAPKKTPLRGSHSYHTVTADCHGSFTSGTHTINTLPWGEAIFVGGIPLATAGDLRAFATQPGERRLSGMSPWVIQDSSTKTWKFAGGSFGASLKESSFQIITNILRYGHSALSAISKPRFGTHPIDWSSFLQKLDSNWIDKRISQEIRESIFKSQGIKLIADPYGGDLGPNSIIESQKNGSFKAAWSLSLGNDTRPIEKNQ